MNIEGTFIGSLTTSSTKLKQTVSLNRRTVNHLDHEICRYKREKEKNTLQIRREKEKFLAKQSRLLPTIPKHKREDELLLRSNTTSRTEKPRPKSTVYLPTTRVTPSPPLCRRVVNDNTTRGYTPSPPLSRRSVGVKNERSSPRRGGRFEYSQSPTFSRRLIGHEDIRSLPLDINKNVQLIPLQHEDGQTKRIRSRSFSDLPEKRKEVEESKTNKRKSHNFIAIERWRKIRDNLKLLINIEAMTNFSIACEKLQDCRYIRHTKFQMMSNTKHNKTRCYCNTCSVSKSRFVH